MDQARLDHIVKKQRSKLEKDLSSKYPFSGLKPGDIYVSPGFTLEKIGENITEANSYSGTRKRADESKSSEGPQTIRKDGRVSIELVLKT